MKTTKKGRPKGQVGIKRAEVLRIALEILDHSGAEALTMRNLAQHLKVTPMALYNHFTDRSALLREVSDMVYLQVSKDGGRESGSIRQRIECLLLAYQKLVLKHPNLTLAIFSNPNIFSAEARRITSNLSELLKEANLPPAQRKIWLNILIDFTHGSSIAEAISQTSSSGRRLSNYQKELNTLLNSIF